MSALKELNMLKKKGDYSPNIGVNISAQNKLNIPIDGNILLPKLLNNPVNVPNKTTAKQ